MFEGRKIRRTIKKILLVQRDITESNCDYYYVNPLVRVGARSVLPLLEARGLTKNSHQEWIIDRALQALANEAKPELVKALSSPDGRTRTAAAAILAKTGIDEAMIAPLSRMAQSDSAPMARAHAVDALSGARITQELFALMIGLLADRDEAVVLKAMSVLGHIHKQRPNAEGLAPYIAQHLLPTLDRLSEGAQWAVCLMLVDLRAWDALRSLVNHRSAYVRFRALEYCPADEATGYPDVIPLLRDPDHRVCKAAWDALSRWKIPDLHRQALPLCFERLKNNDAPGLATQLLTTVLNDSPALLSDADVAAIAGMEPLIYVERTERWEPEAGWRPEDEKYWTTKHDVLEDVRELARAELKRRGKG